jgi:hypothetical protein
VSKIFRRLFEVVLAASLTILVAFTLLLILMPVSAALASLGPAESMVSSSPVELAPLVSVLEIQARRVISTTP